MKDLLNRAEELRQFNKAKERIIDKMNNDLHFTYSGGLFIASSELVSFIKIVIDEKYKEFVILDKYRTPIKITNPHEFYKKAITHLLSTSNECYEKYDKLKGNHE